MAATQPPSLGFTHDIVTPKSTSTKRGSYLSIDSSQILLCPTIVHSSPQGFKASTKSSWVVSSLLASIWSKALAPSYQFVEISPTIRSVEFPSPSKDTLAAHGLIKPVRWIFRLAKQKHGGHAALEETPRHITKQTSAQTHSLVASKEINLIEFPLKTRDAAVVWPSFGKPDQLAAFIFDNDTEPTDVRFFERTAPLVLSQVIARAVVVHCMRFVEGCDVQSGDARYIGFGHLSQRKSHGGTETPNRKSPSSLTHSSAQGARGQADCVSRASAGQRG